MLKETPILKNATPRQWRQKLVELKISQVHGVVVASNRQVRVEVGFSITKANSSVSRPNREWREEGL